MKHNGTRIFDGTTGPPYSQQTGVHHHLNQNNFTKSVHHLNNQPNSSYLHVNSNQINNYHQNSFYLTPNNNSNYYYHYPLHKSLYRINSALNLDHIEFESNLKREFGSVHSIGAISNNCSHLFHNQNNFNNNHNQFHHNENSLSFYSILKEFKRQNLNNHRNIINSNNKVHEYLKARREMSNIELVKSNNLNSVNNYEKSPCLNNKSKVSVIDGAYKSNQLGSNDQTSFNLNKSNEINSLSAYSSKSSSILGSNIALDETVIPSLRLKKKIYRLWDNKTDKSIKNKSKMSENTHSSKNENSEYLNGTTKAIFRKFTRIGSSKNVSNNTNSHDSSNTATDEYRSLNTAASSTHLDDPEVRFEEKLRKKAFAHYDCQSLTANLSYASRLCHLLSKRRNTTTGASAASMSSKHNLNLDLENGEIDTGDDRSNDLVLSCPYFRNELGGEEERCISLNRFTADQSFKLNKSVVLHKPNMTSGLALLEDANEKRWKLKCCPYQKFSTISTNNLEQTFLIENSDAGATYYRNHFYGLEHQNWFGIDENLGPIAISIRRERVPLENCSLKKKLFKSPNENINNSNMASTYSVNSSSSINSSQPNQQTKNQYRIIIRTSELNVLRGTVFEDCVPGLSFKNNNHNNHHAKEILDYIAPEINLSCLKLGVSNADEQLLRLDEQAQTGKYKVGVLYCKAGQSTEEEMYNNETAGPAFEEFLSCLGTRVRLKGFEKYRAGLDNKKDTTGLYSVYSTFADYELMFHVSTLLPYTTDKQQILRKQHIGNDIVTIVFQEPDACQFTPKLIRSHFQHVFIIVKVLPSPNRPPKYSVAISRSKDVPVFGPPIPENGIFTKSKQFTDFLLSKIINAENAAHRSEKFRSMAQRTRHEYLKELAQKFVTNTTINDLSGGSSAGSKLVSIFGGSKKSRSSRVGRDCHFIGDAVIKGAICWEMCVEDFGQSKVIDCLVAISSDSLVIIEEKTKELIFTCPNISILGWSSHPNNIKIFYHQGESISLKCKDPDLDEINEIVNRLKNVTNGCETQEIILKRNNSNQLGFHVGFDGIITHVDMYTYAWQSGLRRYARIVEICKVAIATLSYEQMQDLLKTSITVSITILPQLNEHTPRRGCNLQTCSYVTNPMAYSNTSSNYENINNVFDRFVKNQQIQMQNQNNQPKGFLNVSNSLNYNQTANSNQHQIMGLPSNNNIPSRTNCSSPFSSSSITSKNSTNATGTGLSSNGLSRSKTMLDSSTSSSKKSNLNFMCSVPSTPTMMNSLIPFSYKQNNSVQNFGKNSLISSGLATSSIASSIQDSLNQLSLSTTSSQTNHNHVNQNVECLELGIPTEPIKINLPASKQTSDYNSDTSSSNEWYPNTWSLGNGNSQNKNIADKKQQNSNFFHQAKTVKKSNNENHVNNISNNTNSNKNVLNSLSTNMNNDKKNSLIETTSSPLLRNNYCPVRQQNLLNNRKSNLVSTNKTKNSTLQEDLLKLINPDSYTLDNRDNLSELISNSSNPASNESSNTQYSTPYSSLERSITSCSNKEVINENKKEEDILIVAQPAKVISFEFNDNLEKSIQMNSIGLSSNNEKNYEDKETRSLNIDRKSFFENNTNSNLDWPSLINNANKALAVTQQALKNTSTSSDFYKKQNFDSSKKLSESSKSNFENQTEPFSKRDNMTNYSSFMSKSTSNLNTNSLDEWIKEFENFSENAVNFYTETNDNLDKNKINLSNDEEEKMKNLEECLKKAQNDLDKEKNSKMTLEEQVKHLRQENQRLHKESQTTAAQLRRFTEWFFQNINAK